MDKRETIQQLKICLQFIKKRDSILVQRNSANQKLKEFRAGPKLLDPVNEGVPTFIGSFIFSGIVIFLGLGLLSVSFLSSYFRSLSFTQFLLICVGLTIAVSALITFISTKKLKKKNESKSLAWEFVAATEEPKFLEEIRGYDKQITDLSQQIKRSADNAGLHSRYQTSYAVSWLIQYLETGRCDSLKEAINLLEIEDRERARDRADKQHRQQMQAYAQATYEQQVRATEASEEAAQAANEAAFWASAATFVASTNNKSGNNDGDYHVV